MKSIYKYKLTTTSELVGGDILHSEELPKGAEVLTIEIQNKTDVCLWALVDTKEETKEERKFILFGTGMPIPKDMNLKYIRTILIHDGVFVYHGFELL